jgi:hypothetical protein
MHIKLKQHLAIATGAVSAAAVPMGADAAIGYKDNSNAFSVSYAETGSAEWDIDGAGGNDFRLFTSTASTFRYVAFDSAGGTQWPRLRGHGIWQQGFQQPAGRCRVHRRAAWADPERRVLMERRRQHLFPHGHMAGSALSSEFNNGVIGSNYIGFRFLSGSDVLYGWAESILSTTGGGTVTVNRWAYNDTAERHRQGRQHGHPGCPNPAHARPARRRRLRHPPLAGKARGGLTARSLAQGRGRRYEA